METPEALRSAESWEFLEMGVEMAMEREGEERECQRCQRER